MFEKLNTYTHSGLLEKSKRDITHIVIHCSATKQGIHYEAQDIHRWHKERSWSGIGYHYVIDVAGDTWIGRDVDHDGAHVKGHNKNTIGICLIGGLDEDGEPKENAFTKDQYLELDDILRTMMCMYPTAKVLGHRDFKGVKKQCPCMEVSEFIKGMEC